jgi:hypothetical protein
MISEAGMLHPSFITRTGALQRELDELMTSSIDAQDEKGRTPLMRAVLCDDVTVALQMCTLLLQVRLQCAAVTHRGTVAKTAAEYPNCLDADSTLHALSHCSTVCVPME